MKKYSAYILAALIAVLLASLAAFREDLMEYASGSRSSRMPDNDRTAVAATLSERYDYSSNGQEYASTFLEFGSTGCSTCRQMQEVMETVRTEYGRKVNVIFMDVADPDNLDIVDYFGIVTIPTQVLLDHNGKEYYRHSGYISADELSVHFR